MAAGTASDKVLTQVEIEGYTQAFFPEVFSFQAGGAVEVDTSPVFSASMNGGNTYLAKHRNGATTGDQTPTADTDLTVKAFGSDSVIGVIVRRADALGNEDLASIAGGEDVASWKQDVGRYIATEIAKNAEIRFLQKLVPGILGTGGTLYSTNTVDNSGSPFDYTMFAQAMALMGENSGLLTHCYMHSATFWTAQVNTMLTAQPSFDTVADYRALAGSTPVGMIGNVRIFLNDRINVSGGVYQTILTAPGSLYMGIQLQNSVETDRLVLKAAGTDIVTYKTAYSPQIKGVSFTGTAPTVIGGATDAALALTTNWTKRTGYSPKEHPIVSILHT